MGERCPSALWGSSPKNATVGFPSGPRVNAIPVTTGLENEPVAENPLRRASSRLFSKSSKYRSISSSMSFNSFLLSSDTFNHWLITKRLNLYKDFPALGLSVPSIESVASSRVRLSIALLLTVRPRTLTELAEGTGVSIQAVLKHTKKLDEEGLLGETTLATGRHLRRRKLYSMKGKGVEGFSRADMLVAAFTPAGREGGEAEEAKGPGSRYLVLESLAEDVIFSRASLRDSIKKLERSVSRLSDSQDRLAKKISGQRTLTSEEKHIAYLYFTEDSESRVKDVLRRHFGCADPDAALADVLAKLRGK